MVSQWQTNSLYRRSSKPAAQHLRYFTGRRVTSSSPSRRMGSLGSGLVARWLSHCGVHAKSKGSIRLWAVHAGTDDWNAEGVTRVERADGTAMVTRRPVYRSNR